MSLLPARYEPVVSLEQRTKTIYEILDVSAAAIGEELLAAKAEHPGEFMSWVTDHLPFGIDKAERLMAITRTWMTIEPELRESLPPKWSALYELTRLPHEVLRSMAERREITPEMTVAEARRIAREALAEPIEVTARELPPAAAYRTNQLATDLMAMDRDLLEPDVAVRLKEWLG